MDMKTTKVKMKIAGWLTLIFNLVWGRRLMLLSLLLMSTASHGTKGGPPVTLAFQDAPISVVLQALADYQQLNLVVAAGVSGNISLRLVDVPWEQALAIILRMGHLKVERGGAVMMVFTEQDIEERQQRAEQKAVPDSLNSMTLALQHADAEHVAESLEEGACSLRWAVWWSINARIHYSFAILPYH